MVVYLIAERGGRVLIFREGAHSLSLALSLTDVVTADAGGLLALVADRDFERTHAVFALYTSYSGLRLARFIEFNGILRDRAILLDGLPISRLRPMATLSMGPDRKLYVGLDDGGSERNLHDLGSVSGKVLRLNRDGTTPVDHAGEPIFAVGFEHPTGMDWTENDGTLWLAGVDGNGRPRLQGLFFEPETRRGKRGMRYELPAGLGPVKLSSYFGDGIAAFRGSIFIALGDSRSLLRIRFDQSGSMTNTEWIFANQFDSIHAISSAYDGSLYVATHDRLHRIAPF